MSDRSGIDRRRRISSSRSVVRLGSLGGGGFLAVLAAVAVFGSAIARQSPRGEGAWQQWRGPGRDGVVEGFIEPAPWPQTLTKGWSVALGAGYSSPVADSSRLYLHSRIEGEEVVSALDLASGELIWSDRYPAPSTKPAVYAESEGEGPYSTPLVDGGRLFTVGVYGVVSAYGTAGGDLLWRRDLSELIVETTRFCGTSVSPLLDGGRLIVYVGDDDSGEIAALDVATGNTAWSRPARAPGNGSPIIAEIAGALQIVGVTDQTVFGLDPSNGAPLWEHAFPAPASAGCSLNIPSPVIRGDSVIVGAMDRGTLSIAVERASGGAWTTRRSWSNDAIAPHWSNYVIDGDELFAVSHKRAGQIVSMDAETGEVLWSTEGRSGENGFPVDIGGAMLFLMNEGELIVARKTRPGLQIERRYTVADTTVWSYPLVLDGGIVVRDKAALTLWSLR